MLESIFVGMTGLLGYSRGLKVIANNTTNLNTPGYKSSSLQFADLFYSDGGGSQGSSVGHGLNTLGTSLSFKSGELRQSSSKLDLAVDGQGLFVLKGDDGRYSYTRAGQFEFDDKGVLVVKGGKQHVAGLAADGSLTDISLSNLRTNSAKATTTVTFTGNLSSTSPSQTVGGVKVIDTAGGEHLLDVQFTDDSSTSAGQWRVELKDGTTVVGSGTIAFSDGRPVAGRSTVALNYTPAGLQAIPVTLDFTNDVTSFAAGNLSTLTMNKQDGFPPGALTDVTFDAAGVMVLAYSNGQTVKSLRLALAKFDTIEDVKSDGDNQFLAADERGWQVGSAGVGGFGNVRGGMLEISNVDLSQEFSDLVVMQRGYQASSQIVSTANEMLQELFTMKGK